jgi:hypothetical protein
MKSPFPGMDPFIEACGLWEDFHSHFVERIGDSLAQIIPQHYLVRTGKRSYVVLVESEGKRSYPFLPDVRITRARPQKRSTRKGGTALAEPPAPVEPVTMRAFVEEEHRETFIEIYESRPEQRLVTSVEVLSPSNKRPGTPGWEQYKRKRQSLLLGNVNLVEIDLLRGGKRMPMLDSWPDGPYVLMVARAKRFQSCQAWSAHFQWPLPPLPIPLAKPDPDITLYLQPLVDAIYQRFRYDDSIDYRKALARPALKPEQAAWVKQRLRSRSTRS